MSTKLATAGKSGPTCQASDGTQTDSVATGGRDNLRRDPNYGAKVYPTAKLVTTLYVYVQNGAQKPYIYIYGISLIECCCLMYYNRCQGVSGVVWRGDSIIHEL